MSEESDAIVIAVSEETAQISIAEGGRLIPALDAGALRSNLATLFDVRADGKSDEPDAEEVPARS